MIYTVTFTPSLDYIIRVDNFRTGQINRTAREMILPGGKGVNVSIVLSNLGHDSKALGFTAGIIGEDLEDLLQKSGVSTDFIRVKNGCSRINVKMRSDTETGKRMRAGSSLPDWIRSNPGITLSSQGVSPTPCPMICMNRSCSALKAAGSGSS